MLNEPHSFRNKATYTGGMTTQPGDSSDPAAGVGTAAPRARRRVVKPAPTRRDELVQAAVDLFRERGYQQTTVHDIAAAAGVADGTVYRYFPSKDDILAECHRRLREGMAAHIATATTALLDQASRGEGVDLAAVVDAMVDGAVAYAIAARDLCEVCTKYAPPPSSATGDPLGFLEPLAEVLERGADQGLLQVTDPLVTAHLLGAALGLSLCTAVVYGTPPLDRLVPAAKQLVRRTLTPAKDLDQ
jgi:AcrR family transcriptional regulator